MAVEKTYRLDGLVKRKTLFTVHIRRNNGQRFGVEVPVNSPIGKKLNSLIKLRFHQRKNVPVWMDAGEIVDVVVPEPRG
ncbi:hypothetical protein HY639_02210 [Candidatus Woesearchaeota archaeon]|nr:hypothetical protein [Candidatus Woesearchaeota archaeon]